MHTIFAGIPTLVIMDEKGEVITKNGRGAVSLDKDGEVSELVYPDSCDTQYTVS